MKALNYFLCAILIFVCIFYQTSFAQTLQTSTKQLRVHDQMFGNEQTFSKTGMELMNYGSPTFDNPNYYYAAVKTAPSGVWYRQAGLSPNGQKIVAQKQYTDGSITRRELVLMNSNGTGEIIISAGNSGEGDIYAYMNPFWSDDGLVIGYAEVHNANPSKIVRYVVSSSTSSYIYEPVAPLDVCNPDFVGNSTTSIVFWDWIVADGAADLFNWDGTTLTNITNSTDYSEYEPVSNSDGLVILYWSGETTAEPVNTTHTLTYSSGVWTKDVGFTPITDSYWSYWSTRSDNYIGVTVMSSKDVHLYTSTGTFVLDLTGPGYSGGAGQWNFFGTGFEGPNGEMLMTSNAGRIDPGRDIIFAAPRANLYVNATTGSDSYPGTEYAPFATIQKGINESSGSTVNVAAGTYTEQVTITKSLDLFGAGESSTTILAPTTRAGSVTQNVTIHDYLLAAYATTGTIDVRVEGFTLDVNGQNKTGGTGQMDGVFFRDVYDAGGTTAGLFSSTIHNFAALPDYEGFGVAIYGNSLLTLNDNDISDYTRDGISINRGGGSGSDPNVTISSNTVTGPGTNLNGINIISVTHGAVTGNTVTGNTRSAPWAGGGIVVWTSTGVPITGNHVNGNFYGIDLLDGSHDITISGNDLTDNIKRGISLGGVSATNNNIVKSNTITGPAGGTDDVAIGIANGSTGNMIGGTTSGDGNTILMATTGSGNLYAVHLESGLASNTIRYNSITGGQRAVQLDGPPGITGTTTVSNNTISGQGFGGVCAYNNGDMVITNNSLTNAVRPIEFFNPVNVTVTGNTINGSTYAGINLGYYTGTATLSGNTIHGIATDNNGIWAQTSGAGLNITGNTIYDIAGTGSGGGRGIQIDASADGANIDGNEIYNITGFSGIVIDTDATGVKINNNYLHNNEQGVVVNEQTAQFEGNRVHNNRWGIDLNKTGATFTILHNSIADNNTNPVDSYGLSVWAGTAIAEENWWGNASGPFHSTTNPAGTGNSVSDNVKYSPWVASSGNDFVPGTPGWQPDLSVVGVSTNGTIQEGINLVSGSTVNVAAGTYIEPVQLDITKNITLLGATATTTIVKPGFNTTAGGNVKSESFIYVAPLATVVMKNFTVDCAGKQVNHAIQSRGALDIEDCIIQNVKYGTYLGRGIVYYGGTSNNLVKNVSMNNIERIGIHVRGNVMTPNPVVNIENFAYGGKGIGNWLDYGIEFGGGGGGAVNNANVSNCKGVASTDGSTSAGILVTDYWGTGTNAAIINSHLTNNTTGIVVGYNASDLSVVVAHGNVISGNTDYGIYSTNPLVDATYNDWGSVHGPLDALGTVEMPGNPSTPVADMKNTIPADKLGNAVSNKVAYYKWQGKYNPNAQGGGIAMGGYVNPTSNEIFAGFDPAADDGIDSRDTVAPPPPPSDYLYLYFLLAPGQPLENYSHDVQKEEASLATAAKHWDLKALTDRTSQLVTIEFPVAGLPSGFKPTLYELATGKYRNLRDNPYYEYTSPATVTPSSFLVLIGDSTKPTVAVTTPNGGEFLVVGQPYTITWTSGDGTGVLRHYIYYSLTGTAPYTFIDSTNGNVYSFNWTPGGASSGASIKVVARDSVMNEEYDISNHTFVILSSNNITFNAATGWNLLSVPM